ncbi:MAG: V-type ATP synthase subunit F [Gemmatimonadaceae bacterium]|nr:V-type ATP synthase subunit F [Gemmatimonadaceae bacterium]
MKLLVRAATSPALAPGLRLAGLLVDEISPGDEATTVGERLELAANRADTGILLIEHTVFDAAPDVIKRALEKRALPIIVPIPGAAFVPAERGAEDYILDLLRRAIGYRVRLQ